ncbi:MAG: RHS repeat-associated core domain-containing protein [Kiritimatiellae bacterium]|nr:RHS repeat-associated core domain-containing protein [Kiritimatiellia bacterium]
MKSIGMVTTGNLYRIITDHLGSVRLVVDAQTGAVAQRMDYDEWGSVLEDTNPGFQPFGFAGGLYDPDTGLTRFGYRDYDPMIGRWLARDPILFEGGQANLYLYCHGDSINQKDIIGLGDYPFPWNIMSWIWSKFPEGFREFIKSFADNINPSPIGPIAVTEGITTFTETYVELLNDNAISCDMFEELDSGVDFGNRPPPGNPYRDLPRRRTR